LHDLENCKAKFKIACVRMRAGLTDWDLAKAQKCGEGSRPENAVYRRHNSPPKHRGSAKGRPSETRTVQAIPGRLAIAQAAALIVPNALTALALVHAKGFASARVKHHLNDVGPITAANALELLVSSPVSLRALKKFMRAPNGYPVGRWNLVPQNWLNSEYFVAPS
jgi:hypothetical protein